MKARFGPREHEYRDNNFYALLLNGIVIVACDCRVVNCFYFLVDCILEMIYEVNIFFFLTINKFSLSSLRSFRYLDLYSSSYRTM